MTEKNTTHSAFFIKAIFLEFFLLSLAPILLGGLIFSITQLAYALINFSYQSIPLWVSFIIIAIIVFIIDSFREPFIEASIMVLGFFEHIFERIATFFLGFFEVCNFPPKLSARLLRFISIAIVLAITAFLIGFRLDTAALRIVTSGASVRHSTATQWSDWIAASYRIFFLVIFIVLTFRIMFSNKWRQMVKRLETKPFKLASKTCCSPLKEPTFNIAHASDIHSQKDEIPLTEGGKPLPKNAIRNLFSSIKNTETVDAVVLSGDMTDDGSGDAWKKLFDCSEFQALLPKMVIAPGNHDLNQIEIGKLKNFFWVQRSPMYGQNLRAYNYLKAAKEIMGGRAHLICPFTGGLTTLNAVLNRAALQMVNWDDLDDASRVASVQPLELLEKIFPMAVMDNQQGVSKEGVPTFFVWNTVKPNRWPIYNSIGEISSMQLARAKKLMAMLPEGRPILHVMHHQVALPKLAKFSELIGRGFGFGMVLSYSSRVFDWMNSLRQKSILLHGHHHKAFALSTTTAMVDIVSTPSGTLGCEESALDDVKKGKTPYWLLLTLTVKQPHLELIKISPKEVLSGQGRRPPFKRIKGGFRKRQHQVCPIHACNCCCRNSQRLGRRP